MARKKKNASPDDALLWRVNGEKTLLHTPIYDVISRDETAANGVTGDYLALEAPDWVIVIPDTGTGYLMVKQYRHGAAELTVEFPGGVVDPGEAPAEAAARELREETGCTAELIPLGSASPNPALFTNRVHVFLAERPVRVGELDLDGDEFLHVQAVPYEEAERSFGQPPYLNALMGTAAFFLARYRKNGEA